MKLPWEAGTSYSFSGAPHGVNTVYECATPTDASNLIRDLSLISGLDFGTPENTDVLAVASGTVIFAGDGTNLKPKPEGSAVGIEHGDGFATFYWHLNSIDPTLLNDFINGRTVKVSQGTYLGESGGSGNPRQIHLHLEFRNWPADTPYPAHGISIGGYTARSFVLQSDNTKGLNYQGTMTRGSETQVPHSYCGEPVTTDS
jgi:murein DD-endopeptidase MepM/ murein hydrolase activator NlpD